jgi:type II secretory pathway predicted ATPase ExeA
MDKSRTDRESPLGATIEPGFYPIPSHRHACAELVAAVSAPAGLIVLIGESGTGKTTVLRQAARDVEDAGGRVLWWNVVVPFDEMAAWLLHELGAGDAPPPGTPRAVLFAALGDRIRRGGGAVVAVDEAQHLEPDELGALRGLASGEAETGAPLAVLLAGQPELDARLAGLARNGRGAVHVSRIVLPRLPASEVASYVAFRLAQKGAGEVFRPDAIERVAAYAEGVPRVINHLCDDARQAASQAGIATVDAPVIDAAARLQGLPLPHPATREGGPRPARSATPRRRGLKSARPTVRAGALGVSVAALGLLATALLTYQVSQPPSPSLPPPAEPAGTPPPSSARPESPAQPVEAMPAVRPAPPPPAGPVKPPAETARTPARERSGPSGARREAPSRAASTATAPSADTPSARAGGALVDAAEAGNLTAVTALLTAGAPVDARDGADMTPLMVAVVHDHTAVVELLLARGANVNARDDGGVTALMLAANNGRGEILEKLLRHGAAVNAQTRAGWTPLIYAAWTGRTDMARRLLAAGANPAAADRIGWTALEYARWRAADVLRTGDDADPLGLDGPEPAEIVYRRYTELANLLGKGKTR